MPEPTLGQLHEWCSVPVDDLPSHPDLKIPFRLIEDSTALGKLMARELADHIAEANRKGSSFHVILPCGPKCWYGPFRELVLAESISMRHVTVFHMDECLDWQGRLLPKGDPYNFRTFMEEHFYGGIPPELAVPLHQRHFPEPGNLEALRGILASVEIDMTMGGWGQDGHVAYNQARRDPYSRITLEQLRESGLRIQMNSQDTILALAQRTFGGAYQFVPPMSITLGMKECLSAKTIRLYSDTGSWKQTALRVALFSEPTPEYPMTLLQYHPDALITATRETATHPIAENPQWRFRSIHE